MNKKYDAVIIGAGVAGLYLAWKLGEKGKSIAVLEAKADPLSFSFYTLGSFMDVEKYGFSKDVIAAHVSKGHFYSKHIHIKGKSYTHCNILDKVKIHEELLAKCKRCNVDVFCDARVVSYDQDQDGNILQVYGKNGQIYQGKLYVDCSGRTGILSRAVGLMPLKDTEAAIGIEYNVKLKVTPDQAYLFYSSFFKSGYGWIFPLQNQRAIIGFGTFEKAGKISMKKHFDQLLSEKPLIDIVEKDNDTVHGGVFPVTPVISKFVKHNVFALGDSVSQGSPLLGEGYRFIIDAATIAAPAINSYLDSSNMADLLDYEKNWNDRYFKLFCRHKRLQRLALKGCQHDLLADFLTFLLKIKRSSTFEKLIAGETSRWNLLFP